MSKLGAATEGRIEAAFLKKDRRLTGILSIGKLKISWFAMIAKVEVR
jgi:hypothetical protein